MTPCAACLRRTRLLELLAPNLERARHDARHLPEVLALPDDELLAALGGTTREAVTAQLEAFDPGEARERIAVAGLVALCRHDERYPARLRELPDPPAVLHVAGAPDDLVALGAPEGEAPAVAIVGARKSTRYGEEVAHELGRGLAEARVTVVSGLALGIDSAAHEGALAGGGVTIAVLGSGADHAYPRSKRHLHAQIAERHCVVSEMPPGFRPFRWAFPARNRIIAALAGTTVVVEAERRSGSLITADLAADLGRRVAAVPGPVTSPRSDGANALLHAGAHVVRGPEDVLGLALEDRVAHGGWAPLSVPARTPAPSPRAVGPDGTAVVVADEAPPEPPLDDDLRAALAAVDEGADTPDRLGRLRGDVVAATIALTRLEIAGVLRRERDGRYVRTVRSRRRRG